MKVIRKSKVARRWKWWLIGWVTLFESLVTILSLGYLTSDVRAMVIFSEWAEDIDDKKIDK